jgi:coronin-1B/1C/6
MAGRVVRASKYRHVFGAPAKKENTYDGVKASRSAWDSNKIKVNTKFLALAWEASGGGAFAVINLENQGKLPATLPLVCGHKAEVLDIDFHPFNEHLIASASEDCLVKIWQIPEGGLKSNLSDSVQSLGGHKRKVGTTDFNPVANNVLATSSLDFEIRIWDVEKGSALNIVHGHADIINSVAWNHNGSLLATASKDKKSRIIDPRANKIVAEKEAHAGTKGSRVIFTGKTERLLTVGFSKTSERQYALWDQRNLEAPLVIENIDNASGIIMPFFDADTGVLFLAGKGDGNIRYYELTDDKLFYLAEYKSNVPQRGIGVLPKRACAINECEIDRLYKISGDGKNVEPISFQVPRKGTDIFQDDLFPDTFSGEYSLTAADWAAGQNAEPKLRSLAPGFVAKERPKDEFKPVKQEVEGPKTEAELRAEYDKLKNRVAFLEAELVKRDARIKVLEGGQ